MKVPVFRADDASVRKRRVLRAGRILIVLALTLAVFRAAWRVRFDGLPFTPLADEDVWGYLYPAMSKLTGGGFEHTLSREWVYPGFLFLNLCAFGDFQAITVAQHGLGLLGGAFLLGAWRELTRLARPAKDFRTRELAAWGTGLAGAALAAVFLLSRRAVLTEHTLRPEAVFPCVGALHLWLLLGFVRRRWAQGRPEAAVRWGAGAVFVSALLLLLRPAFGFAAVFVNAPVALALLARGEPWGRRLRLAGVPAALAAILLFLPEWNLARADRFSTILMPAMRLAIHADLVRAQIAADLARPQGPPRFDRAWLETLQARLDRSFENSARPEQRWPVLGFNADYLVAVEPFHEGSFSHDENGDRALAEFCTFYYLRTWRERPGAMLGKIWRELRVFYRFYPRELRRVALKRTADPHSDQKRAPLVADAYYPRAVRSLDPSGLRECLARSDAFRDYLAQCRQLAVGSSARVGQPEAVGVMENVVRASYLPVLGLALAGVAALRRRPGLHVLAAAAPVLFAYNFGMCLTVAVVQTLVNPRYLEVQQVFTLFAWAGGLWLLVVTIASTAARRSSSAPREDGRGAAFSRSTAPPAASGNPAAFRPARHFHSLGDARFLQVQGYSDFSEGLERRWPGGTRSVESA